MKVLSNIGTQLEPLYVVHDVPIYCHNHPTHADVFNAAIKALKDILQELEWPEISGHQILSLSTKNVSDTAGAISIDVSTLENPVTLGTIQLRDNAGTFEFSTDSGSTWQPVGATIADSDELTEGATNLYYTEARVSANTDVAANTAHRNTASLHEKTKVNGAEMVTLDPQNLGDYGSGVFKIEVGVLNSSVLLGTVPLMDFSGEFRVNVGGTWYRVLSEDDYSLIMRKLDYDTDENGIIDKSEQLFDGTDVITIADVQQLQSDVSTLQADVSALQTALSSLDARVTALEGV